MHLCFLKVRAETDVTVKRRVKKHNTADGSTVIYEIHAWVCSQNKIRQNKWAVE